MLCYRDMTFCADVDTFESKCLNTTCPRNLTQEVKDAAEKWWGKPRAPIAYTDFSDTCTHYQPIHKEIP